MNQRQLIKKILLEFVNEQDDEYQDIALDNLSKVGDFSKLREIDKLTLLGRSGDVNKTKRLFLSRMYDEKGNTFGMLEIKVKVKDINEQPIDNKFSKEFIEKLTDLMAKYKEGAEVFKKVKDTVIELPSDLFPLFVTLIRFEYQFKKSI